MFLLILLTQLSSMAQTPEEATSAPVLNAFSDAEPSETEAPLNLKANITQIPAKDGSAGTPIVKWAQTNYNVFEIKNDDSYTYEVEIKGSVQDAKSSYILNFKPLKIAADGTFTHKVNIEKENTELQFAAIGSDGKMVSDPYALVIPGFATATEKRMKKKNNKPKKFFFSPGLGFTSISYSQSNTDVGTLSPIMLTLKLGADYRLKKKNWVLGFVGFMNVLALSGLTATTDFKFLGLNLRIGNRLNWLSSPWELTLSGGLYYLTMLTGGNFGFQDVAGPQLYPTLRRTFNNGAAVLGYFKFSPIAQGFTLMSFTNFELAGGVHYQFPRKSNLGYSVGLDLSRVNISTSDQNSQTNSAQSQTLTLTGTVAF